MDEPHARRLTPEYDAPLETRPAPVKLPGESAINAADRAARPAADTSGLPAHERHNWVPSGPRNLTGRIRALLVHPTDPDVMYAGAASGGVFKTTNGGNSWVSQWHDQESLTIGALGLCRTQPDKIWAATGEVNSGVFEPGKGVYRSSDGGETWQRASTDPPIAPTSAIEAHLKAQGMTAAEAHTAAIEREKAFHIEALAVNPNDPDVCWIAAQTGVYRTRDGGTNWTLFAETFPNSESNHHFSDVVYAEDAGVLMLYLVGRTSVRGEAEIIRLNNPDARADGTINTELADPANRSTVIAAPPPADPATPEAQRAARGKLAVCRSQPNIAYVRYVNRGGVHVGVFRTTTARAAAPTGMTWTALADNPDWSAVRDGEVVQDVGMYALCIAVNPLNPNHVATGSMEFYISTNATAAGASFNRAMVWEYEPFFPGHHADQHAAVFVERPPDVELYVGHDGGVALSRDWATNTAAYPGITDGITMPPDPNAPTWLRRGDGIFAGQMYDLNTSPLLASGQAAGFQDLGSHFSDGGPSWRTVGGGDGGFVAFDPTDPYSFYVTSQADIGHVAFPGNPEFSALPRGRTTGEVGARDLNLGFHAGDTALFAADTVHHPTRSGRVLHSRAHRLYGITPSSRGETWRAEPVGTTFEIHATTVGTDARLEVRPTVGAVRLGLLPQFDFGFAAPIDRRRDNESPQPTTATVRSLAREPYKLSAGDTLEIDLNGRIVTVTFRPGGSIANLAAASAAEVVESIEQEAQRVAVATGGLESLRAIHAIALKAHNPILVTESFTAAAGPAVQIELGGTAFTIWAMNGIVAAPQGLPAVVTLLPGASAGGVYEITIGSGTKRTVTSARPDFANPSNNTPAELVAAFTRELRSDPAKLFLSHLDVAVRFSATGAGRVVFGGTAREPLGLPADVAAADRPRSAVTDARPFNVSPVMIPAPPTPRALTIGDGTNTTPDLVFDATIPGRTDALWPVQLLTAVRAHLAANPTVAVRADLAVIGGAGRPNELTYSPTAADTVAAATTDHLWLRIGGSSRWLPIGDPTQLAAGATVEAVAFHPTDESIMYVGYTNLDDAPGSLSRTFDGGRTWDTAATGLTHDGKPLPITALEVDRSDPDAVYAATPAGVYRSGDRGASWQAFTAGLPNAKPLDLAMLLDARVLRAAVWGRAVWEREFGETPGRDVALYHRASISDIGLEGPPRRGPDALAPVPTPEFLDRSPDIRISRRTFAADAFWSSAEMDRELPAIEPVAAGAAQLFIRIHNRGAFPANDVTCVAVWAPAGDGPPALPQALWDKLASGQLGDLPDDDLGGWHLLSETTIPRVSSHQSEVRTLAVNLPANVADHRRVAVLLLSTSADDEIDTSPRTVAELIARARKAAYAEFPAVPLADLGRIALASTDAQPFELSARRAVHRENLGLAAGTTTFLMGTTTEDFDLSAGADTTGGIRIVAERVHEVFFPIDALDRDGRADPLSTVSVAETVRILDRSFEKSRVPLNAFTFRRSSGLQEVVIDGLQGARFRIEGNARPRFGFSNVATFMTQRFSDPGLFDLRPTGAGVEQRLRFVIRHTVDIPFLASAVGDRSRVSAAEARAIIERELRLSGAPVAVVVPNVDVRIGQSSSDGDGAAATAGGGHLAELVVRAATVTPPASRAALFRTLLLFDGARARPGTNHLYLRSTNHGNVPAADVRHRLFLMNPPAGPVQIDADQVASIDPGAFAVTAYEWNVDAALAGSTQLIIAVADRPGRQEIDAAALGGLATHRSVIEFCALHPSVAYRTIDVE